jgi:hypothetical protein
MDQSAILPERPARSGGEFFTRPAEAAQRRYEALRAYLAQGHPAGEVAARFGYTVPALHSLVRDFRAGRRDFFAASRPGPKAAPAKRTGVAEILAEQGVPRLWRRPEQARGGPRREPPPTAAVVNFGAWPQRTETRVAGLLLAVPDLVALDLPALVGAAGYPGTRVLPAICSVLSLLALKLVGLRRVSTSRTWPPTRARRCSPAWSRCPRRLR